MKRDINSQRLEKKSQLRATASKPQVPKSQNLERVGSPAQSVNALYRIAVEALILPVDKVVTHYKDGYFWLLGRADEVLNIAGHRVGTAEIESAAIMHRTGS